MHLITSGDHAKNLLTKGLVLGFAAVLQGFAMATFLFPHLIPSGGAASVSVLLHYLLHVPYSVTLWVLNASLLLAAVKWLGKSRTLWTMYSVTVTSATVNVITTHMTHPISNVLIDLFIGSVLFGIGLGLLFRMGASSGGMDILALIVSKTKGYSPGKVLFGINGSVLLLTGIVVDWKIILYAVACQFIGTRLLDVIFRMQLNSPFSKTAKGSLK